MPTKISVCVVRVREQKKTITSFISFSPLFNFLWQQLLSSSSQLSCPSCVNVYAVKFLLPNSILRMCGCVCTTSILQQSPLTTLTRNNVMMTSNSLIFMLSFIIQTHTHSSPPCKNVSLVVL